MRSHSGKINQSAACNAEKHVPVSGSPAPPELCLDEIVVKNQCQSNAAPAASRGIAGSRSHYTNEFCQLCTNPRAAIYWGTPISGHFCRMSWMAWPPEFFWEILDKTP